MSYSLYDLLSEMIGRTSELAAKVEVSERSAFIAGTVLAVIVGLLGYRLIKIFMGLFIGLVGYLAGVELFFYLRATTSVIAPAPEWISYVVGAFLAVMFMALGFSKFSYAVFVLYALIGFNFLNYYLPNHFLLAMAGAVVLALLSTLVIRFSFVLISSAIGGFAAVMYLAALLPKVRFLHLGAEPFAVWVAVGIAVFFFTFQYATRRRKKDALY